METTSNKIRPLEEVAQAAAKLKKDGRKIVHCHGVFDLLHIGHIKHLEAARKLGGVLVVTLTADRFVTLGPQRPAFPERLRAEALASLSCVDFVVINEAASAVEAIKLIRPDFHVRGASQKAGQPDPTGAMDETEKAVKSVGGQLMFTDEETFSASALINRFMDVFTPETKHFLEQFRAEYTPQKIIGYLEAIRKLKVLVIGETIVDEYQFCSVMGKSGKEPVLAALHNRTEQYAGGVLAIANHASNFCDNVGLLSALGEVGSCEEFVRANLNKNIKAHFVRIPGAPTIMKRRFLEEHLAAKLFEVYVMRNDLMPPEVEEQFCQELERQLPLYDVVIVADYGHHLLSERAVKLICSKSKFLALNSQANAGNKGFNTISKYPRADFVSIGEPEVRLDARNASSDIMALTEQAARKISSKHFLVTRGSTGCIIYDRDKGFFKLPAFSIRVVDRVGAGDAVLAVTSPCVAAGAPPTVVGFIANVVGAEACTILGHRSFIEPAGLYGHITSLMK